MKRDSALMIAAAGAGIVVWIAVSALGGQREAWDSSLYWVLGMPAMIAASGVLAFLEPRKAWRWALIPFLAQFAWMILTSRGANLWPLGLAFMLVLSLPSLAVAIVVAALTKKKAEDVD